MKNLLIFILLLPSLVLGQSIGSSTRAVYKSNVLAYKDYLTEDVKVGPGRTLSILASGNLVVQGTADFTGATVIGLSGGSGNGTITSVNGNTTANVVLTTANISDATNYRYITDAQRTIVSATTAPYTTAEASKLSGIGAGANVSSVNGQTGAVTLTTANITDSTGKRYVTDGDITKLGNTSGTNTGDQNIIKNIAVSGQSTLTANSTNSTITFSGVGVTITTNATTGVVTFTVSGAGLGTITGGNMTANRVAIATGNQSIGTPSADVQLNPTTGDFSTPGNITSAAFTTGNLVVTGNLTGNFIVPPNKGGFGADLSAETGFLYVSSNATAAKSPAQLWPLTTVTTVTSGGNTIDWSAGPSHARTLAANTTYSFSNDTDGQTIVVGVTNTSGNYTVTWPGGVVWSGGTAPVQTIGAKKDIYTFTKQGSTVYGSAVQNF